MFLQYHWGLINFDIAKTWGFIIFLLIADGMRSTIVF